MCASISRITTSTLALILIFTAVGAAQSPLPPDRGSIFYTSTTGDIFRANLDGSNIEVISDDLNLPWSLTVDPLTRKLYVSDFLSGAILEMRYTGGFPNAVIVGQGYVISMAIHPRQRKIYWTNSFHHRVSRANLDGTDIEHLVTGLQSPEGIALDPVNGKMYWSEFLGQGSISRANLDGSGVELILPGHVASSEGLALDVNTQKLYIANLSGSIDRLNTDGSGYEVLVDSLGQPQQLSLDLSSGKIYWGDAALHKVMRANLDGSDVEDISLEGIPITVALNFTTSLVTIGPGETNPDLITSGLFIEFTDTPDTGGELKVDLLSSATTNLQEVEELEVMSPSGPLTPDVISDKRQWSIEENGLTDYMYDICLSIEDLDRVSDADKLIIVKRDNPLLTWTPLNTSRETRESFDVLCTTGLETFSDFGIASERSANSLPVENPQDRAASLLLEPPFPNPAPFQTTVDFSTLAATDVKLELVDMLGRTVETLMAERSVPQHVYKIEIDVRKFPSGVYFIRLQAEGISNTRKLIVVRG